MAPQIGDLWCEPSSGKGSLAGEVQKVLFFLAIFTLSSGILPRGSNLKEKKEIVVGYDQGKNMANVAFLVSFECGSKTHAQIRSFKL